MSKMVDPRQPRFGQAITGTVLLAGFLLDWPQVIPIVAGLLAGASILGPRANLYAYLYRGAKRLLRLGPPKELEEAAPPRFANTVGFAFTGVASILYFVADAHVAAWTLGLIVSSLALLAATTGLCVGCEAYVIARRIATKGRVAERIVVPREQAQLGA
jgi:hypothetical protein